MRDHYRMFAAYNGWANGLVYEAVSTLDDDTFRAGRGAFFGSLHATLNHILAADRIWMKRFTGTGEAPTRLDAILFERFEHLRTARTTEDERIATFIGGLSGEDPTATFTYLPISASEPVTQPLAPCLAHLFNHQTHHRGQCHMMLTMAGTPSLGLDLSYFLRTETGKPYA